MLAASRGEFALADELVDAFNRAQAEIETLLIRRRVATIDNLDAVTLLLGSLLDVYPVEVVRNLWSKVDDCLLTPKGIDDWPAGVPIPGWAFRKPGTTIEEWEQARRDREVVQ